MKSQGHGRGWSTLKTLFQTHQNSRVCSFPLSKTGFPTLKGWLSHSQDRPSHSLRLAFPLSKAGFPTLKGWLSHSQDTLSHSQRLAFLLSKAGFPTLKGWLSHSQDKPPRSQRLALPLSKAAFPTLKGWLSHSQRLPFSLSKASFPTLKGWLSHSQDKLSQSQNNRLSCSQHKLSCSQRVVFQHSKTGFLTIKKRREFFCSDNWTVPCYFRQLPKRYHACWSMQVQCSTVINIGQWYLLTVTCTPQLWKFMLFGGQPSFNFILRPAFSLKPLLSHFHLMNPTPETTSAQY